MKMKKANVLLGTFLSFTAAQPAISASSINIVTNGIVCTTMLPSQANLVERKSWGILNKTMNQDIWLTCPFFQAQTNAEPPGVGAVVDIVNRNNFAVSGSCLFRQVSQTGTIVTTVATDFTAPPNGTQTTGVLGGLDSAANSFTYACLLPRNSFIPRLLHITAQNDPAP